MKQLLERRRPGFLLALVLAGAMALAACGGDDQSTLERAQEEGYVRIGFANEAPYGFANSSGEVTGEAPEVAKEVLSRMGINEVDGVVTTFSSLIPGLQAGRFDIIAAGMFINPTRCNQILFSDPDYAIPTGFAVEQGNPLGITSYEDVAANSDIRIGLLSGAVEVGYAESAGVSDDQMTIFDDTPSMAEALVSGNRVDTISLTTLSLQEQLDRLDANGTHEVTEGFFPVVDGEEQIGAGGYGFRTEDEDFRDAFNEILVEMKQNNQIVPITQEFGFGPNEINAARDLTAEELCSA